MRRLVTRYGTAAAAACLVGGMLAVVASVAPASAAKPLVNAVTFKVSNADIFDNGYNQSYTSVLTATETGGGAPNIPYISAVTPGTLGTSLTNGFYCGAPTTQTATTASCTIEAAPGFGDDVNIVGASGTSNTVSVADTDNSNENGTGTPFAGSETMIIYPAPVCGAAPDSGGTLSGTNDTIYTATPGANTVAQACFDGADTNPTGQGSANTPGTPYNVSNSPASPWIAASTLILGLNNTSGAGSTIFEGSNAIDAAGGSALTIEAGPGFNWTGGVGSGEADVDTGTAGLNKQAWSGGSLTAAPPSTTADMSASTVDGYNTTTQFKSSGDPANECPPAQALIDAGLPFCFDEFETTGSGPSATQTAVGFAGQNLPTAQAPTAQLSTSSADIGQNVTVNDASSACPATIGGLGAGSANLFSATNNCWYARAGDSTPVTVTVDGNPATVTPNPTQTTVSGVSVTSGSEVTTITPPNAFPTNLEGDLVTDSAGDIPAGTTVTGQGNGTTGNYATIEVTLSNDATATAASDALTFTNNADVSEADYSLDNVSTTTSLDAADSTITLVHENATNQVSTCVSSGTPAGCTGASAGTAATPYNLVGDSVSGTGIPVGTEVTGQSGTSPTTLTLSNSTLAAENGDNETLTFYQAILNPPQLNANFTIPADTPTGLQTVDVCEATTPNNGNDWEFGVQWLQAQGSLSNIAGDSPTQTQICATSSINVYAASSTATTPGSSSVQLGSGNTDTAVVTGNATNGNPTGTVTFYECGPTATPQPCTSQANQVGSPVTVTAGAGNTSSAGSSSFSASSAGYWCFAGYYSGDSNYSASSDTSTDECFDVTAAASSTTSTPGSSSIVLGNTNSDGAVVTGNASGGSPTGTVSFYECGPTASPEPCTSQAGQVGSAVGLTAGAGNTSSAGSTSFTPTSTGYWCFGASYSGDSNYSASSDTSTDECFDVTAAGSLTTTTPSSSSIVLGNSVSDGGVVTGNAAGGSPTGSVSFYECGPTASPEPCTSQSNQVGSAVGLTGGAGNTSSAGSASFTPTSTGYWCFAGYYSGDSNYSPSSDTSTDECFEVTAAASSTASTPGSSSIALGSGNSDGAVVTGNAAGGSPTGSVSFYECGPTASPEPCTSQADPVGSAVGLTAGAGDTSSAQSVTFTPGALGYYCFGAYYSGDSNYSASSDTSTDECFDVVAAASSTTSTLTRSSIVLGNTDNDGAVVTGNASGGSPTGTVSFYECGPTASPAACTSQANQVGSAVGVTTGADDTSSAQSVAFTPHDAGYYCFGAYYSGDSNYSPSSDTSTDECFHVTPASSTTSSLPASNRIPVGGTNSDNVTVIGNEDGSAPTGTVTFYQCGFVGGPAPCTSKASKVGATVTLTPGPGDVSYASSASVTFDSAGTYCFAAYYSGSSNYSASDDTSVSECFVVGEPPTITSFTPTHGPPGTTVLIKGTNLSGALSVTIGGVAAPITLNTATKIKVTVPASAVTGKIKVTTPSGSVKSSTKFTVT